MCVNMQNAQVLVLFVMFIVCVYTQYQFCILGVLFSLFLCAYALAFLNTGFVALPRPPVVSDIFWKHTSLAVSTVFLHVCVFSYFQSGIHSQQPVDKVQCQHDRDLSSTLRH